MRSRAASLLIVLGLAACGETDSGDVYAFLKDYHVSDYLESAARIQAMDVPARESELRDLARDRRRASEVFPLCRMLFVPKASQEFRRPMIGAADFVGGGSYDDWPLEPITLHQGLPILIVQGYALAGVPEAPAQYVEYCLKNGAWKRERYAPVDQKRRLEIVNQFIEQNPAMSEAADWLRRQTE